MMSRSPKKTARTPTPPPPPLQARQPHSFPLWPGVWLYRLLAVVLWPVLVVWFMRRLLIKGKEDPARWRERFGFASKPRPSGPLVWLHGASNGECLSILPLVHLLLQQNPQLHVLVTSGTRTSAKLMATQLPPRALHQYVPIDFYFAVRHFMRHWHPDISVFVESEFWPELLAQAPNPMVVNARMSNRSFRRHRQLAWVTGPLLRRLHSCLCQEQADADKLQALGVPHAIFTGNLKFDAPPLPAPANALTPLQQHIAQRPVCVFASSHPGEEIAFATMLQQHFWSDKRTSAANLLALVVPRHPQRGNDIAAALRTLGLNVAQRSQNEAITPATHIYVADTLGEMGLWYTVANVVVMGGSFVPHGGQNPLEPLKLGTPVLAGPHMFNFKHMTHILKKHALLTQVENVNALGHILPTYLQGDKKQTSKQHIFAILKPLQGASAKACAHILQQLPPCTNTAKPNH